MYKAETPILVFQAYDGHDAEGGAMPLHPPDVQQPALDPMEVSSEAVGDRDDGKFQDPILHISSLTRLRRLPECFGASRCSSDV